MFARVCVLLAVGGSAGCLAGNPCTDREYPDQASSGYVLPYSSGPGYVMSRGNCEGYHVDDEANWFAYDFDMSIGEIVRAARSGVVADVVVGFADGDHAEDHANYIVVRHADNTVARYERLTTGGAVVTIDDEVDAGDPIGNSGDTGEGDFPNLHFVVRDQGRSIPVTFQNTQEHPNGLQSGETYAAEPDDD